MNECSLLIDVYILNSSHSTPSQDVDSDMLTTIVSGQLTFVGIYVRGHLLEELPGAASTLLSTSLLQYYKFIYGHQIGPGPSDGNGSALALGQ